MGNNNSNLQTAKNIKDDEFYTTYEAIEKELQHYLKHFRGKVVLCNCDDPFKSNFCRYFVRNFNKLGLKRLICTSYVASEGSLTQTSLFDCNQIFTAETHGRVLDLKKIPSKSIVFTDDDIENFLRKTKSVRMLCGDGDFRSSECVEYLKQADIVVTNPPFSLFKELVALLVKYQKSYLLIGNQNALTYKEIFPLIQNNQAWTGYQFGDMKFRVPQSSEPRSTRYWVDESGQKWRSLGNAMWLTNLDIERRHEQLVLTKKYDPKEYPHYDTYDAINVRKVTDIPYDYAGIMGVPITIMSLDMSGAVNQVLNYRDELQKNFSTLTRDLEEADTVRAFSPKCVVVIGKISTLNAKQQKAFELYRSSFNNLTIITFDELHQKICDLMSVFKEDSPRPVDSLMDEFSIIDEDYPI